MTVERSPVTDEQRAEWDALLAEDADVLAAMDRQEAWLEAEAELRADQIASARGEF